MKCVKTGCDLYLRNHNVYLHGDLFVPFYNENLRNAELGLAMFDWGAEEVARRTALMTGDYKGLSVPVNLLFRSAGEQSEPFGNILHLTAVKEDHWFDRHDPKVTYQTLLISANQARWHGYGGVTLKEAFA